MRVLTSWTVVSLRIDAIMQYDSMTGKHRWIRCG